MNKGRLIYHWNSIILVCLAIQIFSVSFSIAVSSIAFGIWGGLWILEIFFIDKKLVYDKDTFTQLKYINIFIGIFILADILSRVFAFYPDEAMIGMKRNLLFLIFFVSVIKIYNRNVLFQFLKVVLVIQALLSVGELIQYAYNLRGLLTEVPITEIRIDYLAYPLTTGEIKMMIFFLLFPLVFYKGKSMFMHKRYLLPLLSLVFASMVLTQSRNVFIAIFICMIITGIMLNRKFLYVFIVIVLLGGFLLPEKYTARVKSIVDMEHPSNAGRLTMWGTGLKIFMDNPVIGVGDNKIMEVYEYYRPDKGETEHSHLHSNIFMILATTGVLGFISWVTMFVLIFLKFIKYYKMKFEKELKLLILGCILVLVSFHVSGIFEWSFGDAEVFSVLFFILSIPFILYKFYVSKTVKEFD